MRRRNLRGGSRRIARFSGRTPEQRLLDRLATITDAVWFDPAWDDGVVEQDDGGTLRITSMLSRDLGWTQCTVAGASLPQSPAVAASPNNKRIMSFAGLQFLQGAAALAALLQGSAAYSEVQIGTRSIVANTGRWCASLNAGSPDTRIIHYVSAANVTNRWRIAAGATTSHAGAAVTNGVPLVYSTTYSSTDYDGWLDSVAETLTAGGANTRAPTPLDMLDIGCFRATGTPTGFWVGTLAGLVITPGTVLSTQDRTAIEADLAAYYGY
jgi:hypothetical protein